MGMLLLSAPAALSIALLEPIHVGLGQHGKVHLEADHIFCTNDSAEFDVLSVCGSHQAR